MLNNKNTDSNIDAAFNSIDGIKRATPTPYLLTRINARLNIDAKSFWVTTALFISRPLVMVLSLCLILAINLVVIVQNKSSTNNVVTPHTLNVMADEDGYSTTFVTIETIENP